MTITPAPSSAKSRMILRISAIAPDIDAAGRFVKDHESRLLRGKARAREYRPSSAFSCGGEGLKDKEPARDVYHERLYRRSEARVELHYLRRAGIADGAFRIVNAQGTGSCRQAVKPHAGRDCRISNRPNCRINK